MTWQHLHSTVLLVQYKALVLDHTPDQQLGTTYIVSTLSPVSHKKGILTFDLYLYFRMLFKLSYSILL